MTKVGASSFLGERSLPNQAADDPRAYLKLGSTRYGLGVDRPRKIRA